LEGAGEVEYERVGEEREVEVWDGGEDRYTVLYSIEQKKLGEKNAFGGEKETTERAGNEEEE